MALDCISFQWPLTHCGLVTEIWVNIGSGNGLLPDGTKPLPEPMLTYHQWGPKTFTWKKFHERCPKHQSLKWTWKTINQTLLKSPRGQWVEESADSDNTDPLHNAVSDVYFLFEVLFNGHYVYISVVWSHCGADCPRWMATSDNRSAASPGQPLTTPSTTETSPWRPDDLAADRLTDVSGSGFQAWDNTGKHGKDPEDKIPKDLGLGSLWIPYLSNYIKILSGIIMQKNLLLKQGSY